ncbi:hypothetical protein VPH35_099613 [Triticum aestivum]|uniref:Wall-associated receptor kinase 2 n=1 Tax=Aegilops tauschii TaxID=37682 RepID=M8BZR2_AEGTA|nr:wall-associated receptor kinase 2-like [Triticum aestivum]
MNGWFEQKRFSYDLLWKGTPPSVAVPVLLDWEVAVHSAEPDRNTSSLECPAEAAGTVCRSNHASCIKGASGYRCICDEGYDGNPYLPGGCQDSINECEEPGSRCLGACVNMEGSYECGCPSGTHRDNATGGCITPATGSCNRSCGDVQVPYPFGFGPSYYWPGFNLTCDYTMSNNEPPRLLLDDYGAFRVVDISLQNTTVRIVGTGALVSVTTKHDGGFSFDEVFTANRETPYSLSTCNELILTGCNVKAKRTAGDDANPGIISGCSSFCSFNDTGGATNVSTGGENKYCYGMGCCQSRISMSSHGMPKMLWLEWLDESNTLDLKTMSSYALIAEEGWFNLTMLSSDSARKVVPIVLQWEILDSALPKAENLKRSNCTSCPMEVAGNICKSKNSYCNLGTRGYSCQCSDGYSGNPHMVDGCTGGRKSFKGTSVIVGVASGMALILMVFAGLFIFSKLKCRRAQMLKHKFFEQNRGQLLQQLVPQRADIAEKMIITLEELEKATNNFDKSRELGGGGHGTVYKGILSDLHVVAIKKPKKVVQKEIDEFINEVAILSQINHRNVVKLYGCCLETEVPMLIYEFISNGTLYDHLHIEGPRSLPWENRLRIAVETARSLAYLHSTASVPIIHRDIKSVNILLDDTLT